MQVRASQSGNRATRAPYLETSLAGAEVSPRAAHTKLEAGRAGAHGEVGGVWEEAGHGRRRGAAAPEPALSEAGDRPASCPPTLEPSTLQIFTLRSERLKIFSRSQMRRVSVPEILAKGVI